MRVSEDKTSWKAGGVIRRDFRDARVDPEAPKPRKRGKGKVCKHTCFGKPDLQHQWVYDKPSWLQRFEKVEIELRAGRIPECLRWLSARCERCGRKTYFSWP